MPSFSQKNVELREEEEPILGSESAKFPVFFPVSRELKEKG